MFVGKQPTSRFCY